VSGGGACLDGGGEAAGAGLAPRLKLGVPAPATADSADQGRDGTRAAFSLELSREFSLELSQDLRQDFSRELSQDFFGSSVRRRAARVGRGGAG
jgi:hypothetical protein